MLHSPLDFQSNATGRQREAFFSRSLLFLACFRHTDFSDKASSTAPPPRHIRCLSNVPPTRSPAPSLCTPYEKLSSGHPFFTTHAPPPRARSLSPLPWLGRTCRNPPPPSTPATPPPRRGAGTSPASPRRHPSWSRLAGLRRSR